jgi:hypothetical protein
MFARIVICVYLSSFSVIAIADDFRGLNWGASLAQVKKTEKAEFFSESADRLMYTGTIAGISVDIWYFFLNGRLVKAIYNSQESHVNKNDFISDFQSVKGLLQKKYGTPILDKKIWDGEYYKDKPSQWGSAIGAGQLKYTVQWETEHTSIFSALLGDNFKIAHVVQYNEKKSESEMDSIKEKATLEQL